ncbi:MAG: hypothetical protein ACK58T_19225 [Phycisphaerae bacterium]|jgi:hypothetical protein
MALTREQKVYLSVLAVAASALAADKLFLGVTAPAVAAAADTIQEVAAKPAEPINQEPASARFAARLRTAAAPASDAAVSDLFAVRLVREEIPSAQPSEIVAAASPAVAIEQFQLAHRVTALASGKGAYAVVNGRTIRLGDSIGGLTLVEVTREAAVFASDNLRVEISVVADR